MQRNVIHNRRAVMDAAGATIRAATKLCEVSLQFGQQRSITPPIGYDLCGQVYIIIINPYLCAFNKERALSRDLLWSLFNFAKGR